MGLELCLADVAATSPMARDEYRKLMQALRFIHELSSECLNNGDVRVGSAAEVAMRHIWRKADEML